MLLNLEKSRIRENTQRDHPIILYNGKDICYEEPAHLNFKASARLPSSLGIIDQKINVFEDLYWL